jgi:UDP-N-acetylglucosamine acyltransferase
VNNVLNNAENSIQVSPNANIHKTAILEGNIIIEDGVFVGPYCIIKGNITLSKGVSLLGHVVVSGNTTIGENTTIYHFASIGSAPQDIKYNNEKSFTTIGKNNIIREHVTINSGTLGGGLYTTIGDDNLLMISSHIGHDSQIGNSCKIANNVAIAGHVKLDDGVVIGGNSAVHQFVRMGAYSMLGGMSGSRP